jgi:hypothetical protein
MNLAEDVLTTDGFEAIETLILEQKVRVWPARAFYPSSLGHPCDRAMVWNFTRHEVKRPHDATLESIFTEGRLHQPDIYARLEALGFEVIRESDRPTQYKVGGSGAVISGRPDGRISGFRGTRYKPPLILEAKALSDYQWGRIRTVDDIRNADSHWTRSYYAQGIIYGFLENLARGVFVLKNKATGRLKLIPFELDYDYAETLLQRIERLQPMIKEALDPPPIAYDRAVCGGCGFQNQCYPAKAFGEGASVLDDPMLEAALERRDALAVEHAEYARLDAEIKARLKHEGVKFAFVGPFTVEGKVVAKKAYQVAAHEEIHFSITRSSE